MEQGKTPSVNFCVNQRSYDMTYYLADGIYPSYPTFVKSIRLPQSEPDKLFAKYQEGCRKDIERAFGVLHARFKIIRVPARLWEIEDLGIIMRSLKRREKCAGEKRSLDSKVATEVLFLKRGTSINPFENENKVIATKFQVRESVMRGEGISTPHIRCIQREPLISLALI